VAVAQGTIQDKIAVDCRVTRMHMARRRTNDQPTTLRNNSPSRPTMATAAAPMARFCGEIILPITPADELAAAIRVGERPALWAAWTWSAPNNASDEVSEPVTATPSQPMIPDRKAKMLPAPASHSASVLVWPDWFIT